MATSKATAIRFTDEDVALVAALRQKLGVISTTEVVRMALRALAERQGVVLTTKKAPKKH